MIFNKHLRGHVLAALVLLASTGEAAAQVQLDLSRLWEIGGTDTDAAYAFGLVGDMAFGPEGSVYVLDSGNAVVRVYDSTGRHLRSFGGQGEGPGEFRFPTRMLVAEDGIRVFDGSLKRVTYFDHAGVLVESRTLIDNGAQFDVVLPLRHGKSLGATTGLQLTPDLMRLVGQSRQVVKRDGPRARGGTDRIVALFDSTSTKVDTIFSYDHGAILRIGPRGVGPLRGYWGSGGSWAVSGDSLVVLVDGFQGEVRVLSIEPMTLRIVRSGRVPIEPKSLGESDWRNLEEFLLSERAGTRADHLLGPLFRAQLGEPVFASDGTLWLRRLEIDPTRSHAAGPPVYLVIPPNGGQQYNVSLPAGLSLRAVRGDFLLGQRRSDLGVDIVELWRINQ